MKTYSVPILCIFCLLCIAACNEAANKEQSATSASAEATNKTSLIDGAWELVWEDVGGNIQSSDKPTQIKLFTNGYFSYLMQDSAGNWSNAGAGTFELGNDGKTYKESMQYNTNPAYIGATDWQEYEIKGDTLITRLFTKVIMKDGTDRTADFPKTIEKRVRAGGGKPSLASLPLFITNQSAQLVKRAVSVRKI